jgi:nicotinamide mononucleotide transporter
MLPQLQIKTLDIFITIFSFIATYKESRKILSGWLYWIALNGFSIWLYVNADLKGMASLAAIYFFLSIAGYYNWRQSYVQKKLNANSSA